LFEFLNVTEYAHTPNEKNVDNHSNKRKAEAEIVITRLTVLCKIDAEAKSLNEQKYDKTEKFHFCLYLIIVYC